MSYPTCDTRVVMNANNISIVQMELGFNGSAPRILNRRQTRLARAAWWFATMRATVESAILWVPHPTPPPQQL